MARSIKLNSGYEMPSIGLGTWQVQPEEAERAVMDAVDAGYRHFDCAMVYGNEREIGNALNAKIAEGVVRREDLFVTSKLWSTFHRPEVVEATCRRSLEALQLDYLDLYLMHWPVAFKEGDDFWPCDEAGLLQTVCVEPAATWKAMERLPELGLTRSIGVSNFNSQQLALLCDAARRPPAVNQIEIHPYLTQRPLRAACRAKGVAVVAYSPLGAPNAVQLSNKPYAGAPTVLRDDRLKSLAAHCGKTPAQIMLRYLVQSGMAAIPKSTNPTRVRENRNIFDFELTAAELQYIDSFDCGVRAYPLLEARHDVNYPFRND